MFTSNSRYATAGTYQVTLPDGSIVTVTRIPPPSAPPPIGWYRRGEAERLDVIAYRFVNDATSSGCCATPTTRCRRTRWAPTT